MVLGYTDITGKYSGNSEQVETTSELIAFL